MSAAPDTLKAGHRQGFSRRWSPWLFATIAMLGTAFGVVSLGVLLYIMASDGFSGLSWDFLTSFPSRKAEEAGILAALMGTLWVMSLTCLFFIPLGVGAAIYLEEFASRNWFTRLIETNISTLAGVPSVVYGLLGLAVFVNGLNLGSSIIAAAATLTLLVLPLTIVAAREGLRSVPPSMREAAMALGATKWQAVWHQVLPSGMPAVLTGIILALGRAIGETAPLIAMGAFTSVFFVPTSPTDTFTVLPIQIYSWVSRPLPGFQQNAASGIVVLLIVLLLLNSVAVALRYTYAKRRRW